MTLNQQLTVVLPMHNMERRIRSSVHDLLDLSVSIRVPLSIVIVDDGSTDDTFETACEMARMYPQIQVLRQSFRSGLGSALELIRNRLNLDMAIVHDGVSPIDPAELKELLLN
jgi:glycosyltransferase involved in cell wall biosynthesis